MSVAVEKEHQMVMEKVQLEVKKDLLYMFNGIIIFFGMLTLSC